MIKVGFLEIFFPFMKRNILYYQIWKQNSISKIKILYNSVKVTY